VTAALELAESASAEWAGLVSTAIVGTDRRMPADADAGWRTWAAATDPAVAVLDRAAAVVVARRAGACPHPAPPALLPAAPLDARRPCPLPCAARLDRILAGDHETLLPEWLQRLDALGAQLPWAALPTLLVRGRRQPELDAVVRRLAAGRAEWLADVLPELGIAARPAAVPRPVTGAADGWGPPPAPADSGAAVSGVVQVFVDGLATWATTPQLRLVASAVDPAWLPTLVAELSRLPFHAGTERARAAVLGFAEFRLAMLHEFAAADDRGDALADPPHEVPDP
jgi:hypothetical protein